jgi:hypothetical protein
MLTLQCPRCRALFQVQESVGASVSCPICRETMPVIPLASPASAVTAAPALALPPTLPPPLSAPTAARPENPFAVLDKSRREPVIEPQKFAELSCRSAALWLHLAGGIDFGLMVFHIASLCLVALGFAQFATSGDPNLRGILCAVFVGTLPVTVAILLAGTNFRRLRNHGQALTGCIVAILIGFVYIIGGFALVTMVRSAAASFTSLVYPVVLVAAIINIIAGVKGLFVLSQQQVRKVMARNDEIFTPKVEVPRLPGPNRTVPR